MSKMFETLGPLGQEWCFSKIMDSAKANIQVKKAKIKNKKENVTKKIYLPKIITNQPWNLYLLCWRAPMCCVQVEFFSKLNNIKRKELERYIVLNC